MGEAQTFFWLVAKVRKVWPRAGECYRFCFGSAPGPLRASQKSAVLGWYFHSLIGERLQGEVFDCLLQDFLFEVVALTQKFVGEFCVSLVSICELESIDWALRVVFPGSVVSNQPIRRNVLMHLSYNYNERSAFDWRAGEASRRVQDISLGFRQSLQLIEGDNCQITPKFSVISSHLWFHWHKKEAQERYETLRNQQNISPFFETDDIFNLKSIYSALAWVISSQKDNQRNLRRR